MLPFPRINDKKASQKSPKAQEPCGYLSLPTNINETCLASNPKIPCQFVSTEKGKLKKKKKSTLTYTVTWIFLTDYDSSKLSLDESRNGRLDKSNFCLKLTMDGNLAT